MKICFDISWSTPSVEKDPDGSIFYINTFIPDADLVVDISSRTFSSLASKLNPKKRIFVAGEPSAYMGFTPEKIKNFGEFYQGALLTWHKELKIFPQTKPFSMGCSWVSWRTAPNEKKFGIGAIFSNKSYPALQGYRIRKQLMDLEGKIKIPNMIYHSGGSWNGIKFQYPCSTKKESLDFMFHLAIENCSEEGYFSEKIVDCFVAYSIPLYYGDPKIGDVFDKNGIIKLDTKNAISQINSLTPELYTSKIPATLENFKRSSSYWDLVGNIYNHIKKYRLGENDAKHS